MTDATSSPRLRSRSTRPGMPPSGPDHSHLAGAIEHVPTGQLVPYERNARKHDARQVLKLAGIIRRAGFLVPIIVDGAGVIVAGHGRWAAAKELGLARVPVIRITHLSDAEVRAFRLADNRLAELSSWDEKARALELRDLVVVDVDFGIMELTGFEMGEIDVAISSLDGGVSQDSADRIPEPPATSFVRQGDLFLLGRHRLFCGSSLEAESYSLLLEGRKVQAGFTDPPYNVPIAGHVSGLGKVRHREFVEASGEMSEVEFTAFLRRYLDNAREASAEGALHYVCMDAGHTFELLGAARQAQLSFRTTCTWAKTNAGMGSLYRQQTEFVHVFRNGARASHTNNVQLGKFGRNRTTLWTYPGANTFRKGRMEDLADHPTVKPWALVADAIRDCTRTGDAVLDGFCGSGTTIIAAEKTGRIGFGIEFDPVYIEVAIRRWETLTGEKAVHAATGLTLEALAGTRLDSGHAAPVAAVSEAMVSTGGRHDS